jgi:hypothetical protein
MKQGSEKIDSGVTTTPQIEAARKLIENPSWPFNPNFPKAFSFPTFDSPEWLALALWRDCKGDTTKKIKDEVNRDWQTRWYWIHQLNYPAAECRYLKRIHFADAHIARSCGLDGWQEAPTKATVISFPDTEHYRLTKLGEWVETLLNEDYFWEYDINAWAFECVKKEFEILNPGGADLVTYAIYPDGAKQCEDFRRRFHAYQQARYRYHEHLLEKHCERALGGRALKGHNPETAAEARGALIGWLSKQRGHAENPLVKEFRRAVRSKKSTLSLNEKKSFHAERTHPSKRKWRADADEIGWLILTWPIWNFHDWRFVDISYALNIKFRVKDKNGKPLDFLAENRNDMIKEMRPLFDGKCGIPAEQAFALFEKHLVETPEWRDWRQLTRKTSDDKAIDQLCQKVVRLSISPRPKGAPVKQVEAQDPPLWDFAYGISV